MRRYNIVSLIPLILTITTFALAAPVQVQEKRQAPEDVITVLGKRTLDEDLYMMFGNLKFDENGLVDQNPAAVHLQGPAPPPDVPPPNVAGAHVPPPNVEGVLVPEVHVPPQGPTDSDHESMVLNDDAPPTSTESGHLDPPMTSPRWSTQPEGWYTAPSNLESDTESDSWSTISNAPSEGPPSENWFSSKLKKRGSRGPANPMGP